MNTNSKCSKRSASRSGCNSSNRPSQKKKVAPEIGDNEQGLDDNGSDVDLTHKYKKHITQPTINKIKLDNHEMKPLNQESAKKTRKKMFDQPKKYIDLKMKAARISAQEAAILLLRAKNISTAHQTRMYSHHHHILLRLDILIYLNLTC